MPFLASHNLSLHILVLVSLFSSQGPNASFAHVAFSFVLITLSSRGVGFCNALVSLYTDHVLAYRFSPPRFPCSPLDEFNSRIGCGGSPLVGSNGLEPSTSRLSGVRSNHLSYEPISVAVVGLAVAAYLCCCVLTQLVEMNRIELSTPCLQGRCSPS